MLFVVGISVLLCKTLIFYERSVNISLSSPSSKFVKTKTNKGGWERQCGMKRGIFIFYLHVLLLAKLSMHYVCNKSPKPIFIFISTISITDNSFIWSASRLEGWFLIVWFIMDKVWLSGINPEPRYVLTLFPHIFPYPNIIFFVRSNFKGGKNDKT